ncbi:MFS transporter [Sphingorhabdus sp.]|uniref:MFS transporter n=1 Tax=Sphingorhabdus sp. TaxID=1902408 RepID=UPI0035947E4A
MTILTALPALSENRRLRLWAFFLLYVTQGIPFGLAQVAIPAWLAANGASATEIGAFIGIVMLPWSLKLVNGLLMDRFCYRPMGRMRAWIIGSQAVMIAVLLVTAALNPGPTDLAVLTALIFTLLLCSAFNDVAVDGMAVDLVPEEERERITAFMSGGQVVGISASAMLAGVTLVYGGVALTALTCALLVGVLTIMVTLLRERVGERLLPWTAGTASPENLARGGEPWLPIIGKVLRGLFRWRTLLYFAGVGMIYSGVGMADVFGPSYSVSQLGWSSAYFTNFSSITGFISVIMIMVVAGPIVSRLGTARFFVLFTSMMLLANLGAFLALSGYFGAGQFGTLAMQLWSVVFWAGNYGSFVVFVAWSMNLTNPAVAASMFALFMAIPNLTRSFGAGAHGQIIDSYGYDAAFLVAAISIAVGMAACLFAGLGRKETLPARDSAEPRPEDKAPLPQPVIA